MKLFRELYHYREMLFSLVRKDLRGRYKGSVLGFLWTFINPLMQLLVYTFVFTVILPAQVEHYSLYLFVALHGNRTLIWIENFCQQFQRGTFAAAVVSDQSDRFAPFHLKRNIP